MSKPMKNERLSNPTDSIHPERDATNEHPARASRFPLSTKQRMAGWVKTG